MALAFTNQIWMLVFSRILQGLSAAGNSLLSKQLERLEAYILTVVYTVGLAIITDTVDPKEIGHYMGYALSAMSFGVLAGPPIGSLVYSVNYMAVVSLMAGVALVDIMLRLVMIEKGTARAVEDAAFGGTERSRLIDETHTSTLQPSRPGIWKTLNLLSNPGIATALYGVFVHFVVICSFDGVLPIYLAQTFQWSSLKVGLCFLAIGIPNVILGPLAGKLSDAVGPRWLACGGCLLSAVPVILLQLIHEKTEGQMLLLFFLLALIGMSCRDLQCFVLTIHTGTILPFIVSPLAADLFYIVEILEAEDDGAAYAQSYGLFTCALAGGTLGGPVIAGYLKESFGWNVMAWGLGALVASGAIPVVRPVTYLVRMNIDIERVVVLLHWPQSLC